METIKKKVKVVMLPTKEYTNGLVLNTYIDPKKHKTSPIQYRPEIKKYSNIIERGFIPQHLYFFSDEKIKEGDWCIITNKTGSKFIAKNNKDNYELLSGGFVSLLGKAFKIIATTDKRILNKTFLPHPTRDFIKAYCRQGGVDEVLVEYNNFIPNNGINLNDGYHSAIKVNQYNEITTYPVKVISFTAKELKEVFFTIENRNHIEWIYNRLKLVHNEEPGVDYMLKLKKISDWLKENL